ncbi:hypothetical protein IJ596_04595 [bacterium]|nr:hypothetical protein [bacterium]
MINRVQLSPSFGDLVIHPSLNENLSYYGTPYLRKIERAGKELEGTRHNLELRGDGSRSIVTPDGDRFESYYVGNFYNEATPQNKILPIIDPTNRKIYNIEFDNHKQALAAYSILTSPTLDGIEKDVELIKYFEGRFPTDNETLSAQLLDKYGVKE